MGYVAVGVLFLLIASAFITYLVVTATRRSNPARAHDPTAGDREDSAPPGIGPDDTALGDTAEHSDQPSPRPGVTGADGGGAGVREGHGGRFKRDPIGGEGEGERTIEADVPRP